MSCKSCLSGAFNTGTLSTTTQGLPTMLLYTPLVAADGSQNRLEIGGGSGPNGGYTLTDILALVRNTDPTKRIYPSGFLRSVGNNRADAVFETFDDDSRAKLRDGLKTFNGIRIDQDGKHLKKWRNLGCRFEGNWGAYILDICNNIHGEGFGGSEDPYLYPVPIDTPSLNYQLMHETNSNKVHVLHQFDWQRFTDDVNLCMFRAGFAGELEEGVRLQNLNGLIDLVPQFDANGDVIATASAASQTVTTYITAEYGGAQGQPVELPSSGFLLFNLTTSAISTADSVVYDDNGTAVITFPAASFAAGNELRLQFSPTAAAGYSGEQWFDATFIATA